MPKGKSQQAMDAELVDSILNTIHSCYVNPEELDLGSLGLEELAKRTGHSIIHPQKSVTVLIVGNHSSGKSSLINWYTGERVQSTGMSMETRGFTVVTHGQSSRELVDSTALLYTPHINLAVQPGGDPPLTEEEVKRFHEFYSVQVSTSKANNFPSVTFVDTPGMIDGDVKYRFDPGRLIQRLAVVADLIWVFLDPHGSSTCSRTMATVKALNDQGMQHKMGFFLTKADTVESIQDLQKLTVQLTQRFAAQLSDTHAIAVPALWIPGENRVGIMPAEDNALPVLLREVERSIQKKVQASMERLRKDAGLVCASVDEALKVQAAAQAQHASLVANQWYLLPLFLLLWTMIAADATLALHSWMPDSLPAEVAEVLALAAPAYAQYGAAAGKAGVEGWFMRLLAQLVGVGLLTLVHKFLGWRLSGVQLREEEEVQQLAGYRATAEDMLELHKEVSQAYVDAAKAPEFTANVLKRRGKKGGGAAAGAGGGDMKRHS